MDVLINPSWKPYLQSEFNKPYFKALRDFIRFEYKNFKCFPKSLEIFKAFDYSSLEKTKVVILGQDPYHGFGQANGLCFSVNNEIAHPPSLVNIFKELKSDLKIPYPKSGNLLPWAKQGVLLLNTTLTVRAHQAGSHQNKGWEQFTDAVINAINNNKKGVVFLLWGGYAKNKKKIISTNKHFVLESGHPSPLSANRGYWFGNKHFSKTNSLLERDQKTCIYWNLK